MNRLQRRRQGNYTPVRTLKAPALPLALPLALPPVNADTPVFLLKQVHRGVTLSIIETLGGPITAVGRGDGRPHVVIRR